MSGPHARQKGVCRLCDKFGSITRHHLVPLRYLRQEGTHLHEPSLNLIRLCAECHRLVERLWKWRARLRLKLTPEEIEYGQRVMGLIEFSRMYRTLPREGVT